MEIWSVLIFGVLVGMQHALEADHLAAVAALSAKKSSPRQLVLRGAYWGLGHTLSLFAICGAVILLGLAITERVEANRSNLKGLEKVHAESQRFTGRALVALAQDPDVLRHTGQALPSRDLADLYGFVDVDGSLPDGPLTKRPSQASGWLAQPPLFLSPPWNPMINPIG